MDRPSGDREHGAGSTTTSQSETARVAVVADSTVSLSADILQRHRIITVPLGLSLGETTYRDGIDLSSKQFYTLLAEGSETPKTSAPSPAAFLEAFRQAEAYANSILCITLAKHLSATYQAARVAAEMARDSLPKLAIHVLDSRTAGGSEGLVALAAARGALTGQDLSQVVKEAESVAGKVQFLGVLDTLYYLWRGGHIPKVAMWVTSLLNVKPVLDMANGEVRLLERPRTRERALHRVLAIMAERVGKRPLRVNVMHADSPHQADRLVKLIGEEFHCAELLTSSFTPVIGAHTGPGLLAVAFYTDPT